MFSGPFCEDDGKELCPWEIHSYLCRVMYNRRNKFDPLWYGLMDSTHHVTMALMNKSRHVVSILMHIPRHVIKRTLNLCLLR